MKLFRRTSSIFPEREPSSAMRITRRQTLNQSLDQINLSHKTSMRLTQFLTQQVPIYSIHKRSFEFQAEFDPQKSNAFLARGDLIGKVYQTDAILHLQDAKFVGKFSGVVDDENIEATGIVYFQGRIEGLRVVELEGFECDEELEVLQLEGHTRFQGVFKGNFFSWDSVGGQSNVMGSSLRIKDSFLRMSVVSPSHCYDLVRLQAIEKVSEEEYFLPSLMRFEVEDIREINLGKSMAKVSGYLFLEIRYNEEIGKMLDYTIHQLTRQFIGHRHPLHQFKNNFKINLTFSRDVNVTLPLIPLHQQQTDHESESEWSLGDGPEDIEYENDRQAHVLRYRVMKGFNCQIDNSFGVFFAPFNLNVLRLVIGTHFFEVLDEKNKQVKMSIICVDTADYDEKQGYNPFRAFSDLSPSPSYSKEANRLYKVSRQNCSDSGEFILADNRMISYPYYRHVLRNSNTNSEDWLWAIGKRSKASLIEIPPTDSISQSFTIFETDRSQFSMFSFPKFTYQIFEIPIYKYVIIDMIKVFGPLTLLAIISLFIFKQQNGIGSTLYTTLAYRLVNVATLMISYVSLISMSRTSLPPTPGVTLVEMLIYCEIVPNFLALLNSMIYYKDQLQDWKDDYKLWADWVFLVALVINFLCLGLLLVVLLVYRAKEYTASPKAIPPVSPAMIQWRSPLYKQFMENVRTQRKQYTIRQLKL